MAEFRIRRADIVALNPCEMPSTNMRYNDENAPGFRRTPLQFFDRMVTLVGLDPQDLVFPDGWTEMHSLMFYQAQPIFHQWAMKNGLIPQDNVASRFPMVPWGYSKFSDGPRE